MADYIYLLENRLSPAQRSGLRAVREVARSKGLTVFLVGGAVRDLTSGSPVRDLDVVVQGDARKLKKDIEKAGAVLTGELDPAQAFFVRFPGGVRMEIGSTLTVAFSKPGKPVAKPATILDDLRRRDFTANAMALSLNGGSYGLLMDPLNGVADIENRQLRLVSNYGFIEDPVRMIRAARLMARLGWTLDEKTQARYETGKSEGYISALPEFHRGYETEEIVHEEDPLRVLSRLESEGWMKYLAPYWIASKVNATELARLRDVQAQLQMQGIDPDLAAASFPLLTAKLTPKEVAMLKGGFPRQGFVAEVEALEGEAKEFAGQLGGKAGTLPSQAWRLITSTRPEAVLWTAYSSKSPALQAKFKSFASEWPAARQKMPYALMQEMRIVPDVPGYDELLEKLFFELMDGKLGTSEEMKAFLEPYSPPAPPPPVNTRKLRGGKKDSKPTKSRAKKPVQLDEDEEEDSAEAGMPKMEESGTQENAVEPVSPLPFRTAPLKFVMPEVEPEPALSKSAPLKAAPHKSAPTSIEEEGADARPAAHGPSSTAKKAAMPAKKAVTVAKKIPAVPAKAPVVSTKKAASPAAKKVVAAKAVPAKKIAALPATAKKIASAKKTSAVAGKNGRAKKVAAPVAKKVAVKPPAKAAKVAEKGKAEGKGTKRK